MSRTGSFKPAADLVARSVREAGEARGFAATRLLTHWPEIAGPDLSRLARPRDVRFPKGRKDAGGATLVLEVLGPAALRVDMEKESLRQRVNAAYGYAAIAKVRIVQVGPDAFAKPTPLEKARAAPEPSEVEALTEGVGDTRLRLALAALAANVLTKSRG